MSVDAEKDESGNREGRTSALIAATLAAFLTPFMSSAVNVALPTIGREFQMDAVALSWIATSFLLSAAIFLVPCGRLGDIFGRKRLFLYGTIIYAASSLACALSMSGLMLIGFRVVQGVGGAMIFGTGVAILTTLFPPGERGRVLGINVASTYLGLSLGPFVGGYLTYLFGWRSIFFSVLVPGIPVIVFVLAKVKGEWYGTKGERFDIPGGLVYACALIGLMYGFSQLPGYLAWGLIVAGVVSFIVFVRIEGKVASPLLDLRLFRENVVYALSNLAALINYSATFAVTFLLSLYLQYIRGLDPQHAGMIIIAQPAMMTLLSPLAGRLSDVIEPRIVASTGMGLTALGIALLSFLGKDTPVWYIIGVLLLLGSGFAFFSSPNTNAVMSSVEKRWLGVASATLGTMRLTGQMLSMGIAMLVFAVQMGRVQVTPEVFPDFLRSCSTAFLIFAVLCALGVFASLARGKVRPG